MWLAVCDAHGEIGKYSSMIRSDPTLELTECPENVAGPCLKILVFCKNITHIFCTFRRARYTMGMGDSDGDRTPSRGSPSTSSVTADASAAPKSKTSASALPDAPSGLNGGGGGGGGDLLDLEDIFGGGGGSSASPPSAMPANGPDGGGGGGVDLLADIFAGNKAGVAPSPAGGDVFSGNGNGFTAAAPPAPPAPPAKVVEQEDDFGGFEVAPSRDETMVVSISAFFILSRGGIQVDLDGA